MFDLPTRLSEIMDQCNTWVIIVYITVSYSATKYNGDIVLYRYGDIVPYRGDPVVVFLWPWP